VLEYTRPPLYFKQSEAMFHPFRYGVVEASTKAGKTVVAIAWLLEQAMVHGKEHQNYWWVAPIVEQARIAYNRIKNGLTAKTFDPIASPTPRITLANGAILSFKSGDNPDSLYGEDVYAAVVDEASRCKEESWHALRSTLTSTEAPVRIIGNVKGRKNWFYRLARLAQKEGEAANMRYSKITVLDAIEAGVISQKEVEDARRIYPEDVFRELYMAEAQDDEGNPFGLKYIERCTVDRLSDASPVAFGIDLGKKNDYFVVIGLDAGGRVVVFQRWRNIPWGESVRRVHEIVGEDVPALVDSTGLGDPVLEQLQIDHGNFKGYLFSNLSKQKLMEGLAVSIQSYELSFPRGPISIELESFEYQTTPTRTLYAAPQGEHDDCVCALALAREQWSVQAPGQAIIKFYQDQYNQSKLQQQALSRDEEPELALGREFVQNLSNEYNRILDTYRPHEVLCYGCGLVLDRGNVVSDGVFKWHPGCVR
jgi:hypothetical protein